MAKIQSRTVDPEATPTSNYGWLKPAIGASDDLWGVDINGNLDGIDTTVKGVSNVANAAYPASNPSGYQTAAQVTASLGSYLPLMGVTDGSNASAGQIGEVISSNVTTGVTLTTATTATIASIALTAGDWDVGGEVWFALGTGGAVGVVATISPTVNVNPGASAVGYARASIAAALTASTNQTLALRPARVTLSAGATYYLLGQATFGSGTATATGNIMARRAR